MDRSAAYDFLLTLHSNHMALTRTVSEIDGDRFQSEIAIFPIPVNLTPALKGFPLELGIGAKVQK